MTKNGIQAIMIENAIPELEDEANRILARVTHNAMHLGEAVTIQGLAGV